MLYKKLKNGTLKISSPDNSNNPNKIYLTEQEKIDIRKRHRTIRNRSEADKLKVIVALSNGYSYEEISNMLLIDETTARTYEKKYKEGGIDKLL